MKFLACFAFILAISLPADGFAYSDDIVKSEEPATVEDMEVEHLRSDDIPGKRLKVDIYLRNFTDWDTKKMMLAKSVLEQIMNSEEFKKRVLGYSFKGERRFHRNENMTNEEIYEHFMTGAEDLMPEPDGVMNFDLTLYRSWNPWSTVKGYTKPDTMRIWIHKKFFRKDSWTIADVAANLAHEWVHKMGFGHAYEYNDDRPSSVPYAVGNIVNEIATEMGY